MSAPPEAIAVRDLTVRYRGKPAVSGLSLSAPRGSVYALLGDNGAGKSTTMKVLTGQIRPDAGTASILGLDCWAHADALRHKVGYVPDRPKLYDWMTVSEIGWFTGAFHRPGFRDRYLDWAGRLALDPGKKIKDFSKGGYARVGLALALAADPDVLLLDEPTSGLDLHTRREFLANLVDLAAEGRTILISSHSISELERFCSHVAIVFGGKVTHAGTLDQLRGRFRRIGFRYDSAPPDVRAVGTVCETARVGRSVQHLLMDPDPVALESLRVHPDLHDFEETAVNLEDVYAALTRPPQMEGPVAERNGKADRQEVGR
ncbi:MAG: ATP-binding cassette domain-containing protein [Fimbriiglobus sp.]|jgi:ABC-2 type transport system ATP-binding protein|nr:ATP-binding cassette domain-containing protein [Fimbriiglobus sp.]